MKCFCCGEECNETGMARIDFLGEPKFVCEKCEEIARCGRRLMPQVECSRPWVLAIERRRGPVGCLYEAK
jgi:hypothetical protein